MKIMEVLILFLINQFEEVDGGEGWREERTGLHELEFIETRRYWHSTKVTHQIGTGVNVLMIIEGDQALVESPKDLFKPFVVNYAEAFIIPANISEYSITPSEVSNVRKIIFVPYPSIWGLGSFATQVSSTSRLISTPFS